MRIWLLHIGEDLPVDGNSRTYRYGYLASALQDCGHEVLRWAPTFRHTSKCHRFATDTRVRITPSYEIQFVHSPGYARNASVARLRTYRVLGRRLRELAKRELRPDVIVAAIPSLEWTEAAIDYGQEHSVPVVVDVRDLWPDVFLNAVPSAMRAIGRYALAPYRRIAQRALSKADAVTAVSESYLKWACSKAGRLARPQDTVFPLGFEPPAGRASIDAEERSLLMGRHGLTSNLPICLFAGLFEHSSDLETVIRAARRLQASDVRVQFAFCGDGSKRSRLERQAIGLDNVHFLGWLDAGTLQSVTAASDIGLCAYSRDALQSLPNKPFEYLAAGLPIVSSLAGEMAGILKRQNAGLTYLAGDDQALANCISKLVRHPQQLAAMRDRSYETWSKQFRSSEIYSRFARLITELALRSKQFDGSTGPHFRQNSAA